MKKCAALLLAVCITMSVAVQASAIEVQVGGRMDYVFGLNKNTNFTDTESQDTIRARQRSRLAVQFIASENLRGVIQFQIGTLDWGSAGAGLDTTSSSALTRRAYLDWSIPDSTINLKVGLQEVALPSAVAGNPAFASNVAGIVASVQPTDPFTLTGFWARPFNRSTADLHTKTKTDVFGLIADVNLENVRIAPWGLVALIGGNSIPTTTSGAGWDYDSTFTPNINDSSIMYNVGIAVSAQVTPQLAINFDAMYGKLTSDKGVDNNGQEEGDGWFVTLGVDYKLDFGTPGIILWYGSGNEDNDKDFGQMPVLGVDGGFIPLRLSFLGSYTCGTDTLIGANGNGSAGVVLQIKDMSFVEKLSHTLRFGYIVGTNEKRSNNGHPNFNQIIALNEEDYAFEVDFDSIYEVNKNLDLVLELGWIHLKADHDYYNYTERHLNDENAFNAQIIASFHF
jgi:hypothetical protein